MTTLRSFWNEVPAVRLLLPYMAGILLCIAATESFGNSIKLCVLASVLLLVACGYLVAYSWLRDIHKIYRLRLLTGSVIMLLLLAVGYLVTYLHTDKLAVQHLSVVGVSDSAVTYHGVVTDPITERERSVRVLVAVDAVLRNDCWQVAHTRAVISLERDSAAMQLRYGDALVFSTMLQALAEPKNPHEFHYKNYQSYHNIYHRGYVRSGAWLRTATGGGNWVLAKIYALREYFLGLVKSVVPTANELAVATALLLGYREYMNAEVMDAYSCSGALHVLSVSGLHVGIVYLGLQFFLGWMDKRKQLRYVKAGTVIAVMLVYACLTGLSPSVMRAVVMFSLITISKASNRFTNMYNVLAGSCLLLLLYDPFLLTEVGFKLSYLAVVGIVYIHPLLYKRWAIKNPVLDMAWSITCMSIAAQIATAPLSILYFHQFPNYFLLSNLIIIPASNLVLGLGIALFAVGWCAPLAKLVGLLFYYMLYALNWLVFKIDALPYALYENLVITQTETYVIYLLIVLVFAVLAMRSSRLAIAVLVCVLVLCSFSAWEDVRHAQQHSLIVYHVPKQHALAFVDQQCVFTDFDTALQNNESAKLFHIRHHWWAGEIAEEKDLATTHPAQMLVRTLPFGKLYRWRGKTIVVIDRELPHLRDSLSTRLPVDVLVVAHNPRLYFDDVAKLIDVKQVVLDTSNKPWRKRYWLQDCQRLGLKVWDCEQYAYVMEL